MLDELPERVGPVAVAGAVLRHAADDVVGGLAASQFAAACSSSSASHPGQARLPVSRVPRCSSPTARGRCHPWALVAAANGLDACVPAPDALTVGQASKLVGDLLAVRLVIPADLPDESASALADARAPCPELIVGCGGRRRLGVEGVLRILLEQRIDGPPGAEVAGFGRSGPPGEGVNLVEVASMAMSMARSSSVAAAERWRTAAIPAAVAASAALSEIMRRSRSFPALASPQGNAALL